MQRSERTQMYLDLARLSLSIEQNITDAIELGKQMVENPNSSYIKDAIALTAKMKDVRYDLYEAEATMLVNLCQRENNAVEIGTLEVLPNGKVVAVE